MATKIDLMSSPHEMIAACTEEYEKAVMWYNKKKPPKKERALIDSWHEELGADHSKVMREKGLAYNPPSGNKWMMFHVGWWSQPIFGVSHQSHVVAFDDYQDGEGQRRITLYELITDEETGKDRLLVFCPHFFDRYNERVKQLDMSKDIYELIPEFLSQQMLICFNNGHEYEHEDHRAIDIRLEGCIGLCELKDEAGEVVLVRTVLADKDLRKECLERTKDTRDRYDTLKAQMIGGKKFGTLTINGKDIEPEGDEFTCIKSFTTASGKEYVCSHLETMSNGDRSSCALKQECTSKYFSLNSQAKKDTLNNSATDLLAFNEMYFNDRLDFSDRASTLADILTMFAESVGGTFDKGQVIYDKETLKKLDARKAYDKYKEIVRTAFKQVSDDMHLEWTQEDEDHLEEAFKDFYSRMAHNSKNLISVTTMNKEQINALKECMKKNGVKNYATIVSTSTKFNADFAMEAMDALYAVSRFKPDVPQAQMEKYEKAEREWLLKVLENDWCPAMAEYNEKYGKDVMMAAVMYDYDNGGWSSPKGRAGIKSMPNDYYRGIASLEDETIEFVIDNELYNEYSQYATKKEEEKPADAPLEYTAKDGEVTREDAISSMEFLDNAMKQMRTAMMSLDSYVQNHIETDAEVQVKELEQKLANALTRAENAEKKIQKLTKDYDDAQKRYIAKNNEYEAMRKERNTMQATVASLNTELEETKKNYDALKEAAKKSAPDLPVKKIVKKSKILEYPYVGIKSFPVICDILEQQAGCVIDMSK